ncbi:MAG: hypothetical protein WBO16_14905 [Gammaproteobacteria bacterium]
MITGTEESVRQHWCRGILLVLSEERFEYLREAQYQRRCLDLGKASLFESDLVVPAQ